MRRALLCLLLLAGIVAIAGPASGAVRNDPVKVTLVRGADPAPGESPRDLLRIEAASAVTLDGLALDGPGWRVNAPELPRSLSLAAGEVVEIPFTAVSASPAVPIQFRWLRAGRDERRTLDLSPEARGRDVPEAATIYRTMSDAQAGRSRNLPGAAITDPLRELDATPLVVKGGAKLAPGATQGIIIVTGYVVVEHERTGEQVPVGGISVRATAWNLIDAPVEERVNTDGLGFFYVEIDWNGVYLPDVHLIIKAANASALVEDATWETDWTFGMTIYDAEPGYAYDVGVLAPSTTATKGAFYIAETLRRGAQYLDFLGYPMGFLEVQYPDSDGSFYRAWAEEIHLAPGKAFNEGTILHEYGHYWNDRNARFPDFDYCNGECDDEVEWWFDDCGHCMWCEESGKVAWIEGIAHIVSRTCTDAIKILFTVPDPDSLWVKEIQTIGAGDCSDPTPDPTQTEGYFAALMYDLVDSHDFGEDDPKFPGYKDVLGGNIDEVFSVLVSDPVGACDGRPTYPTDFVECFLARNYAIREGFWETAMNNGFDCDETPPGVVTNLSGYPAPGTPYPDATIDLTWTAPLDDASGIAGYAIDVFLGSARDPGLVQHIGDVNSYTTNPLSPGRWYFSIRAKDRAGRWSPQYTSIGPFIVEAVVAADLQAADRTGWDFPAVPRDRTGATGSSARVTTNLTGGADTYWNIHGENTGTELNPSARVAVYVDDEILDDKLFGSISGHTSRYLTDLGPITVDGGRHILGMFLDSDETFSEASETDNYWAGQWAWRAGLIDESQAWTFAAPPINLAGFAYFNFLQPYGPNCRGHRITSKIWAHGAWMYAVGPDSDYDLKMFDLYSGPEEGFLGPIAVSEQGYNKLEAVLANGFHAGSQDFDLGVFNNLDQQWGDDDYRMGRMVAQPLSAFGSYPDTVDMNRMMNLYVFGPLSGTEGYVTLTLNRVGGGDTPLAMAFFSHDLITGGILDADETKRIWSGSTASMTVQVPPGETGSLAIWQDPSPSIPVVPYTLTYEAALPDPGISHPVTWAACVVPRPEDDMVWPFTTVPAPSTLPSDPDSTWFYFREKNYAPIDCPQHVVAVYLDGELFYPIIGVALTPFQERGAVGWQPLPVRGGRHTATLLVNSDGALIEETADNNLGGSQWVWEPTPIAWSTPYVESAPPPATGGWSGLAEYPDHLNCLGYATPDLSVVGNRSVAAYLVPQSADNYDLRLHPHSTGAEDGLAQHLANSNYAEGEAEFVVFKPPSTPSPLYYDLGVVNLEGTGDFALQLEQSDTRSFGGPGTYGTYTLAAGDMLNLHKIILPAGAWSFTLSPETPNPVDVGFSLHPYDAMTEREGALGLADNLANGASESFSTGLYEASQTYVMAVWRSRYANRLTSVDYTMIIEADVTGIGETIRPPSTRLLPASPNPFTQATSISFELAEAGETKLSVFDMQGRLVRELRRSYLPPGRHEARWDGRDITSSRVASGLYFIRLESGDQRSVLKVVRVD